MEVVNRGVAASYDILDKYEAGVVLNGNEAKTALLGRVNLSRSYVKFVDGELYWVNGVIYVGGEDESRRRKLLVRGKELSALKGKMAGKKLTLIPLRMYNKGRLVKLEFGLARPLKKHEKREKMKKKDIQRDIERAIKEYS